MANDAKLDYDKAIELAPDFVDAIVNRTTNKCDAGAHENAIEDYSEAIRLDPTNCFRKITFDDTISLSNDKISKKIARTVSYYACYCFCRL